MSFINLKIINTFSLALLRKILDPVTYAEYGLLVFRRTLKDENQHY